MAGRARTFTKNTANYMSLGNSGVGAMLSGLATFSVSARIRIASTTAGVNDNNVLAAISNGTTSGFALCLDGSGPFVRLSARSVSTDARQVKSGTTALSTGIDYYIGGVVKIGAKTIEPFLNGVSEGVSGALTFANATWTLGTPTDNDAVGGFQAPPTTTPVQFDGEISQIALWSSALVASDFASLAAGTLPTSVQAGTLIYYLPVNTGSSPELPTVGTAQGTITGSLPLVGVVTPRSISVGASRANTASVAASRANTAAVAARRATTIAVGASQ